ncbi:AbiF-like protein [[Clostridium] sordellii]|uniref:Abi family protein n=1 Tax=Paraclostridium sordellii TaxID=1505 RepID=UPI0005E10356|nr:Abi family protein [Paeniclostridium sordellii]CEQ30549.1 AbiF-like protein [[Clostridium] sordellii] [Paeniclostridium sordellii]
MSEKQFRDFRVQIRLLESRGVVIKNKRWAKRILATSNYYDVINGYKEPFLSQRIPVEKYKSGTKIEEIYALYEFDRRLRSETLEVLLKIENKLRTNVAYVFSKQYGHKNYLMYENFDLVNSKNYKNVGECIANIHKKIACQIDKNPSIKHYMKQKGYVPLWVVVNILSFGDISKFYSNMKQSDRANVAKRIKYTVWENKLKNYIEFLAITRNVCAHSERLYNYKSIKHIKDNHITNYFGDSIKTNDFFSVLIGLKLILDKREFECYFEMLVELINILDKQLDTVSIDEITNKMGFPSNWKDILTL